jgi:hypothetical protein
MSVPRKFGLSIVVAVAMACSSDRIVTPPRDFVFAAATRTCGPADGPAIAVYLATNPIGSLEPSTPYVRVFVPRPLDQLSGHAFPISGINAESAAWYYASATNPELATEGYILVSSVGADNTIEGSVDLQFSSAGHIKGGFRAELKPQVGICV